MMKSFLYFSLLGFFLLSACGGRIPSTETAQDIVKGYFNKYGKKYKDSPFGDRKVQQVQVLSMEEIQKHLAYGTALITLDNAAIFKIHMNFIYKAPLGWKQQGWELLSSSQSTIQPENIPIPAAETEAVQKPARKKINKK